MPDLDSEDLGIALEWCREELGGAELDSDESREHGYRVSSTNRVRLPTGRAFLKLHTSAPHWAAEVRGYELWAPAFGERAPTLLAVRDELPLALVVSEIPGSILEQISLSPDQEEQVWHAAGKALASLHKLAAGPAFGETNRYGSTSPGAPTDPITCLTDRLSELIERASHLGILTDTERRTAAAALQLVPAFQNEKPTPCHRDYCAANWLVDDSGQWSGVIDFEFSHYDVRAADFTRDAHWTYLDRPELPQAMVEGYGQRLPDEQILFAHAEYAVGAVLWGHENDYRGFEQEGRLALAHLATRL